MTKPVSIHVTGTINMSMTIMVVVAIMTMMMVVVMITAFCFIKHLLNMLWDNLFLNFSDRIG